MVDQNNDCFKFPFESIPNNIWIQNGIQFLQTKRIAYLPNGNPNSFTKNLVTTNFTFELARNRFTDSDIGIIICSKDNGDILKYSLSKIKESNISKNIDILLIDDRSKSNDILDLSDTFKTSYLKIDNSDDMFNYSVINNIGVGYLKYYGKKTVIFYNNDMWPSTNKTIESLIEKHNKLNSDLTGCRLVYPTQNDYEQIGKPQHILSSYLEKAHNTIQHGGIFFTTRQSQFNPNAPLCIPNHLWRFFPHDHYMACSDNQCGAVTGALHIVNIDKFIKVGGLNPSLSNTFQDMDLCMRFLENNMSINYVGSEFMYHAESISISNDNLHKGIQFISDNIMWDYLWNNKIINLLGFQK